MKTTRIALSLLALSLPLLAAPGPDALAEATLLKASAEALHVKARGNVTPATALGLLDRGLAEADRAAGLLRGLLRASPGTTRARAAAALLVDVEDLQVRLYLARAEAQAALGATGDAEASIAVALRIAPAHPRALVLRRTLVVKPGVKVVRPVVRPRTVIRKPVRRAVRRAIRRRS